jgi:CheY-like chemotaxis protein
MPVMDGLEASRKIISLQNKFNESSSNYSDARIVAVTSNQG